MSPGGFTSTCGELVELAEAAGDPVEVARWLDCTTDAEPGADGAAGFEAELDPHAATSNATPDTTPRAADRDPYRR
jgi:hypothetical protein